MTAIRIAGIGVGGIFRAHLRGYKTLSDSFSLVALCDINEEAAQRIAEENKIQRVYTSVEALLKDGDIDAVHICLPHDLHAPVAIAAAEAGYVKHGIEPKDHFTEEIRHLGECILADREPLTSGVDTRKTMEICIAANRAMETQSVVRLPLL